MTDPNDAMTISAVLKTCSVITALVHKTAGSLYRSAGSSDCHIYYFYAVCVFDNLEYFCYINVYI